MKIIEIHNMKLHKENKPAIFYMTKDLLLTNFRSWLSPRGINNKSK